MMIFIIGVIVAIICYAIGKKRKTFKNDFEILKYILWVEACVFMIGYFFTDKHIYKQVWMGLLGAALIISIIFSNHLKRKK